MKDRPTQNSQKLLPALVGEGLGMLTIGWDLAVPIFGGVLLGHFLDQRLSTRSTFTLGLLALGVVVSFFNLSRLIRRLNQQDQERDKAEGEQEKV